MHQRVRYYLTLLESSDDPRSRHIALKALAKLGRRFGPDTPERRAVRTALVAVLRDEPDNVDLQLMALRGLRRLADPTLDPRARGVLTAVAAADDDPRVRGSALHVLAGFIEQNPILLALALLIMGEPDRDVRHRGVVAIAEQAQRSAAVRTLAIQVGEYWLDSNDYPVLGLDLLRLLDVPGEAARCERLLSRDDAYVRWAALNLLRRHPERDDISLRYLDDEDVHLRREATKTLGARGASSAFEALSERLDDEDYWIARYALDGLAKIDSPAARQRLLRAALDSPRAHLRLAAVDTLRWAAGDVPLDDALAVLQDEDEQARRFGVYLVSQILSSSGRGTLPVSSPVLTEFARLLAEPESGATSAANSAVLEHTERTRVQGPGVPNPHLLAPLLAALERPESQGTPAVLRLLGLSGEPTALPAVRRWRQQVVDTGSWRYVQQVAEAELALRRLAYDHAGAAAYRAALAEARRAAERVQD